MKQTLTIGLLAIVVITTFWPIVANAADEKPKFSFVPCNTEANPEPCQLRHFVFLISRVINYLITVAAIVAMYQILSAGFTLVRALGNSEVIERAKTGLSNAVVGFGMIILAFVFVNLLLNGVLGDKDRPRKWWDPDCIYNINFAAEGCVEEKQKNK